MSILQVVKMSHRNMEIVQGNSRAQNLCPHQYLSVIYGFEVKSLSHVRLRRLPGSSVHGIFQAIVLEWIAISFSRGSSQPRDQTWVSPIVDRRFTIWATREVPSMALALSKWCHLLAAGLHGISTYRWGNRDIKRLNDTSQGLNDSLEEKEHTHL